MSKKYVIVQHRIQPDKNGVPKIEEVVLAYPDTHINARKRVQRWRAVLEMTNVRLREAMPEDYRKRSKPRKKKLSAEP